MTKKIVVFFLAVCFLFSPSIIIADDCDPNKCNAGDNDCLSKVQSACTQKLSQLGNTKNTLSKQIQIIDSNINLTISKITQTENSIKTLEKEIGGLTVEIDKLDGQLDNLSVIFINQIVQNYKLQKRVPAFAYIFGSNLNDFLERHKYITTLQKESQNNLIDIETVRTNYDLQKNEKEKKQTELEELKKTLAIQQTDLNKQKSAKNSLLAVTKNDEKEYQRRLLAVQSKFSSFASTNAQCLTSSPGAGSDGNYFSQIDPRWCTQIPAGTEGCIVSGTNKPCTIGNIGCYITSTSMVLKKLGVNTNPSIYASDINHMESSADMKAIDVPSGYNYCKYSSSSQQEIYRVIDNELNNGRYVIAQVPMSPYHFVVLIKGSNGNYSMHDPWKGADLSFNYSRIISARLITTQSCP